MAFAKVNRGSRSFDVRPNPVGQKNMFDLSHDYKTTFTMGKLVPFLTIETLPGDEWFIRGEYMMRFAPLYLPIMHRVNMSCDYFYVPNRILFPDFYEDQGDPTSNAGWTTFIYDMSSSLLHPVHQISPVVQTLPVGVPFELFGYMGFPSELAGSPGIPQALLVNAFPANAYFAVWDQYYRNDQIQDRIWFPLLPGTNVLPNAATQEEGVCLYRNWNRDAFTSATPTPQVGSDVQIPLVDVDFMSPSGIDYNGPFRWKLLGGGAGAGVLNADSGAPEPGRTEETDGDPLFLDIQETAGTIAQLRNALMLQEWLERSLRAGDRYSDRQKAFWNEDPFKGVIQVPEFLGSKRGKVIVSEVMSTTETATLKVGNYAGQAMSLESTNDTIKYHCKEHGIILGIISVYPDSSYMQGIERMWLRELPTDYAWQQFALIGDQAILNKEVNYDLRTSTGPDPDYNDEVFGYNQRYWEYRYVNDKYTGLMRSTFISFHLGRLLSVATPENTILDSAFIECRPDITRVFQVEQFEDEIYAHIYNDIKVLRMLPKFGIPAV